MVKTKTTNGFNIYYKILGIEPTNSIKKIKDAYKKQLYLWHPDRIIANKITFKEANDKTVLINDAYNFLKDNITYETDFEKIISDVEINWNTRQDVVSSNLAWVEYYPNLKFLIVCFKKSGVYLYENVPITIYKELISADSKGKYFNMKIVHGDFVYHHLINYNEWYKYAKRVYKKTLMISNS